MPPSNPARSEPGEPTTPAATPIPIRERQRRQTRDVIFEVAMAEIAEHGLAGVRIEHIARKSGVTRPTVYAHFPTREDFLREMQERADARALAYLRERLDGEAEGGDGLFHTLVDGLFDMAASTNENLRRESFAMMLREPRSERWLGHELFSYIVECVAKSQARGELPEGRDPEDLTRITLSALFAFISIEGTSPEARRRDAHQLLDWLLGQPA